MEKYRNVYYISKIFYIMESGKNGSKILKLAEGRY